MHVVKDALYRIFESRKSLRDQIRVESDQAEVSQEGQLRFFRLNELRVATNLFAVENIIGRGEFTIVYRGIVDNIPVAVKKWDSYADGLQEWENEMNVLCNMRHPNLIKLLGYCNGHNEIILVYELMNNGDLEQFLSRGHLDAKADVYAFGIVMLQLLSGLKVFDRTRPSKKKHLVSYFSNFITNENKLREFMDPTLGNRYQWNHAFKLGKLCKLCVLYEGSSRPDMHHILEDLESICPSTS